MLRNLLLFLISSSIIFACSKNDLEYQDDSNYPTVIKNLGTEELSEAKTAFSENNIYLQSSLNQFGFCAFEEIRTVDSPPTGSLLTEPEAIEVVKSFVSKNNVYTGIKDPAEIEFTMIDSSSGNWERALYWSFRTTNQKYRNIEVLYTQLIFNVKNKEVVYCTGNWFSEIYIPSHFNFTADKAKDLLLNKVVSHYTLGGEQITVKITSSDLNKSSVKPVIFPVTSKEKIELRVTWQINIPGPAYYIIYVDVMTGKIIGEEPTVFS